MSTNKNGEAAHPLGYPPKRSEDQQKGAIAALEEAGALVYVAADYESFFRWFAVSLQKREPLIPRLATPELPLSTKLIGGERA